MNLLLDSGAPIALEQGDRRSWRRLEEAKEAGSLPTTHGGVIAQVWRGGTHRQALLARALQSIETVPLDAELGRRAGVLLARSGLDDAVDAALAALAVDGDQIVTSDPYDLSVLAAASGRRIDIVAA